MSEKHRNELAETATNIGLDVQRLHEMSAEERYYFWREFFDLRDMLAAIERERPQYDDGSKGQ